MGIRVSRLFDVKSVACVTVLALATLGQAPQPARADVVTAEIADRMAALMGQDHRAFGSMSDARARRLVTPPEGRADAARLYDASYINSMPEARGNAEWQCLTEALYHESRGESIEGQFAVAEVILNRVEAPEYPDTVCGVVQQGNHRRNACQFSYSCDGRPDTMADTAARLRAGRIARLMLDGAPSDLTQGATHFHATWVNPSWNRLYPRTTRIGVHIFYRMPTRLSQN